MGLFSIAAYVRLIRIDSLKSTFESESTELLPADKPVARTAIRCARTINQIKYKSRITPHHPRTTETCPKRWIGLLTPSHETVLSLSVVAYASRLVIYNSRSRAKFGKLVVTHAVKHVETCLLSSLKVHCRVQDSPPLDPVLLQLNRGLTFTLCFKSSITFLPKSKFPSFPPNLPNLILYTSLTPSRILHAPLMSSSSILLL